MGEDQPRTRLAGRDRVPSRRGPDGAARRARVQSGRLRLHDVHRQQRSAAGAGLFDRQGQEPGRGLGAVRQSKLRGPHPVAGRGRTISRRRRSSSPTRWPARCRSISRREPLGIGQERRAGAPARHLAERSARFRQRCSRRSAARCSTTQYAHVFDGDERWQSLPVPQGEAVRRGTVDSTYIRNPPFFDGLTMEPAAQTRPARRARPRAARRQRHDRSHLAGRLDSGRQPGRQVADRARRRAARLQLLRRAPRQPRSDDARHVREHPPPEPARARHRRRLDDARARRRGDDDLRRVGEAIARRACR